MTANNNPDTLNVSVLLGNGYGGFTTKKDFTTGSYPYAVALADLNADGKLDIVTTNLDNTSSVLIGNGNGTFKPRVDYAVANLSSSANSYSVAVGDVNNDQKLDIIATNKTSNSVSLLLGQ